MTVEAEKTPGLSFQAFWLIVARFVGFAFTMALPVVLTRVFSQQQFGIYKQAFVVVGTVTTVLSFGFALSAYYYLPRLPEKRGSVILNIVLYHLLIGSLALLLFLFWPGILQLMLGDAVLTPLAPLIGAVIFSWLFGLFLENAATVNADVVLSTVFIIMAQVTKGILLVTAALLFQSVEAILWAALIQGLLQSAALLWYLGKRFPGYLRQFDAAMAIEQFRYSAPFGFYGLLYTVQTDLHNYISANQFSSVEYAVYAVGTAQLPFAGILRDSVNSVLLPRISKLQLEGKKEEIISLLMEAWRRLAAALLPACAVLLVLGRDFITLLYTQAYVRSVPIFTLNLSLLFFAVFVSDAVIRTHTEKSLFFLGLRLATVVLQIPASILAIQWFGLAGPLVGVLAVTTLERIVSLAVVLRLLDFGRRHLPKLSGVAGFGAAAAIAGFATAVLRTFFPAAQPLLNLAAGGVVFSLVYVASILLLKLLNPAECEIANRFSLRIAGFPLFNRR